MDINSNQSIIATGDRQSNIKLWDYNTGSLLREIPSSAGTNKILFNKNGTRIYSVINHDLIGWDVNSGSVSLTIDNFYANRYFALNENRDIIAGSLGSQGVGLWELNSSIYLQQFSANNEAYGELIFSPGDNYLIGQVSNSKYRIWDIKMKWVTPVAP
jgi:WD40 repeat protein